jgi:RES domain-containing protein
MEGMLVEMGHGFGHRFDPLTICSYNVDVDDLLDLRTGPARTAAAVDLADMACPWALDIAQGKVPASWNLAGSLIAKGAAGILCPSFATGARPDLFNLVLWRWGPRYTIPAGVSRRINLLADAVKWDLVLTRCLPFRR